MLRYGSALRIHTYIDVYLYIYLIYVCACLNISVSSQVSEIVCLRDWRIYRNSLHCTGIFQTAIKEFCCIKKESRFDLLMWCSEINLNPG